MKRKRWKVKTKISEIPLCPVCRWPMDGVLSGEMYCASVECYYERQKAKAIIGEGGAP